MARLPRLYAPGLPNLVLAEFARPLAEPGTPVSPDVLNALLGWLAEGASRHQVSIHGWTLLADRIVLLATPADSKSLSMLIQSLGRNLAARLRSGRVFAGRYRSALIEPGQWVLPALIWLETLPQRAGLTPDPETWPWSSAASHTGAALTPIGWMQDHADYWSCGNTPFDRQANYRNQLHNGLSREQARRIEQAVSGQWALGSPAFLSHLSHTASRRAIPGQRGRPRKTPATTADPI